MTTFTYNKIAIARVRF